MTKSREDLAKYCQCMEEIKRRIDLVRLYVSGATLGREEFDYELISLNLRKILELIAFASLVANKEKYSAAHKKYLHEWRTNKLLENIEKLNPDFYPKALKPVEVLDNGVKHFPVSDKPFLSRAEFTKLLNLCNDILHAWNPYTPRERKVDFERHISEWVDKIQWLLDVHYVRLAGNKDVIVVVMHDQPDGKVHAYYCATVQN